MLKSGEQYLKHLSETAEWLKPQLRIKPSVGLILGSGLGHFLNHMKGSVSIPYSKIPHFPRSTVVGHSGNLVFNRIGKMGFIAMQGRVHFYEGYSISEVVFPLRVLVRLGITSLIVTNAAGGINRRFKPGDLMLINDHINLMGVNPLMGPNLDELGPRFPDMSDAYSLEFRALVRSVAKEQKIKLQEGVYVGLAGPSYETPAEIRMLGLLGADAVGMSTVPEVIAANHSGVKVMGISCITNMAAGILPRKLDHAEVMETTARVRKTFGNLLNGILKKLANSE
ncbi:MAG TPA: purine-nucleoside phosphorylase [Acidobacteriota bacterium]